MTVTAFHSRTGIAKRYSLIIGVAAAIGCILGAAFDWQQFLRGYLFAWLFLVGLSIGGLALVMVHNLTGGVWGLLVRRLAIAQMQMLPLAFLMAAPLIFGVRQIYPWATVFVKSSSSGE